MATLAGLGLGGLLILLLLPWDRVGHLGRRLARLEPERAFPGNVAPWPTASPRPRSADRDEALFLLAGYLAPLPPESEPVSQSCAGTFPSGVDPFCRAGPPAGG